MTIVRAKDIKMVKLSEIKLDPKNRNKHPKDQIERLAKIIEYQGFRDPVTISNLSGYLKAGEGRYLAAKKLNLKEIPATFQDFDNEDQETAFGISHNAIHSWAELDLSGINADVPELGPDFDIEMLGIKNFTIDAAGEPGCDEDEVPEQVEPKTKLGDIYKLGNHRLMCGDSTSIDAVEKLMDGKKADMVFTDPPYGVEYVGLRGTMYTNGKKAGKNSSDMIKNDDLSGEELSNIFRDSISNAILHIDKKAALYIFFAINKSGETLKGIEELGLVIRNWLIWDKGNVGYHAMNAQYKPNYESFLYCHIDGSSPDWHGDVNQQTIWRFSTERLGLHPTMKPVTLIENALKNHKPETVMDLFGGSGSTLIACEKNNTKCFMMELDPHYCDVIVARWEKYTGQKAEPLNG